jgi:hypothetical protein
MLEETDDNFDKFLIFKEFVETDTSSYEVSNNKSEIENCLHLNTINESDIILCNDCGLELFKMMLYEKDWAYKKGINDTKIQDSSRCFIRRSEDKTIYKDVENLGFPEKIINMANDIFDKVTKGKTYRGNSRKAIVFGCIFNSCKITGHPCSCDLLREIFSLDRKIVLKGLKYVNLNAPKMINSNYITPIELIGEYFRKHHLPDEHRLEVISLYNKTKDKSSVITRSRPQSIANSYIYYYLSKKLGVNNFKLKEFSKAVNLSELTISKICREISRIVTPISSPPIPVALALIKKS